MFGRKEQETLFVPSERSVNFLKVLLKPEVQEKPGERPRYRHCELCQEKDSHPYHRLFNKERNAWIEWSDDRLSITFKPDNYTETFLWSIKFDGEEIKVKLESYEAVNIYDPPLFSKISTLSINEGGAKINLSLTEIGHNVLSLSREEIKDSKYKYLRPLFQDPAVQKAALEKLLKEFSPSIVKDSGLE